MEAMKFLDFLDAVIFSTYTMFPPQVVWALVNEHWIILARKEEIKYIMMEEWLSWNDNDYHIDERILKLYFDTAI